MPVLWKFPRHNGIEWLSFRMRCLNANLTYIKEFYALSYPEDAAFSYTNRTRKDVADDILDPASLFDNYHL